MRKLPNSVGSLWCILCRRVVELDYIFWSYGGLKLFVSLWCILCWRVVELDHIFLELRWFEVVCFRHLASRLPDTMVTKRLSRCSFSIHLSRVMLKLQREIQEHWNLRISECNYSLLLDRTNLLHLLLMCLASWISFLLCFLPLWFNIQLIAKIHHKFCCLL